MNGAPAKITGYFLMEYEPGELIAASWMDNSMFQIVLSGELSICFIRDDGSMYSLADGSGNYIIGEMELFLVKNSNIYAEVTKKLTSIAFATKITGKNCMKTAGSCTLWAGLWPGK